MAQIVVLGAAVEVPVLQNPLGIHEGIPVELFTAAVTRAGYVTVGAAEDAVILLTDAGYEIPS